MVTDRSEMSSAAMTYTPIFINIVSDVKDNLGDTHQSDLTGQFLIFQNNEGWIKCNTVTSFESCMFGNIYICKC
jgi:hypothetical protein